MTKSKALSTDVSNLLGGLKATKTQVQSDSGNADILRMLKDGDWVYGADDIDVEPDSLWALNPMSIQLGYIAWLDQKPVGEAMAPMGEDPIVQSSLPEVGAPYKRQITAQLACVSGEDAGVNVITKQTSHGGKKEITRVIDEIIARIEGGEGTKIVPIFTLENDNYKHKEYGKIYTAVMSIQKWVSMDDLKIEDDESDETPEAPEEPEEEDEAPEPPKKSKRRTKKKPEPEPEEDDDGEEEEAPTRRKRRTRK
tara:strand:+ start:1009 stop:1767 length:759 start_codon:yes stop_codon:yes gene_type:complete